MYVVPHADISMIAAPKRNVHAPRPPSWGAIPFSSFETSTSHTGFDGCFSPPYGDVRIGRVHCWGRVRRSIELCDWRVRVLQFCCPGSLKDEIRIEAEGKGGFHSLYESCHLFVATLLYRVNQGAPVVILVTVRIKRSTGG
jgi:hypothetical protein